MPLLKTHRLASWFLVLNSDYFFLLFTFPMTLSRKRTCFFSVHSHSPNKILAKCMDTKMHLSAESAPHDREAMATVSIRWSLQTLSAHWSPCIAKKAWFGFTTMTQYLTNCLCVESVCRSWGWDEELSTMDSFRVPS